MAQPITIDHLRYSSECITVDDIVFVPAQRPEYVIETIVFQLLNDKKYSGVKKRFGIAPDAHPHTAKFCLLTEMERQYGWAIEHGGPEPEWVSTVPSDLQAHLRRFGSIQRGTMVCYNAPLTHLGFIVLHDGLVDHTDHCFSLFRRMSRICQLGFLHQPVQPRNSDIPGLIMGFKYTHTRWDHVLTVMALITAMAHNNGLSDRERYIGRIAALTHDALTPAGGDTTKHISPRDFDEDLHYPEIFNTAGWTGLSNKYGVIKRDLIAAVRNQGVLGSLLDIADKLAYVSRDAQMLATSLSELISREAREIREYVRTYPDASTVWQHVRIDRRGVYVTKPHRLYEFLLLRVMLFKHLYYGPATRTKELLIGTIVLRSLYRNGELTRAWLLENTDEELEKFLAVRLKWNFAMTHDEDTPNVEEFATLRQARRREKELLDTGEPLTLIEDLRGKIKPGTSIKVLTQRGTVKPFHQAYPELAASLHGLADTPTPFRLYWYPRGSVDKIQHLSPLIAEYRART